MNRYYRDLFVDNCRFLQNEAPPNLIKILWHKQSALLRLMITTLTLLAFFWLQAMPAYAQENGIIVNISYETVTIRPPLEVGEEITYKIFWACSSSTKPCGDFDMDYTLPDGLEFVDVIIPDDDYISTESDNVINISTKPGAILNDGDTMDATIVLRVGYYENPTPDFPVQGTITVTADPDLTVIESDPLDPVTLIEPDPRWSVSKVRNLPVNIAPSVGNPVGYEVKFCSASTTGNVDLTGAVLVDTYPAGATVIDDGGGTDDPANNTITWTVGNLNYYPPNNCFVRNIILEYPPEDPKDTSAISFDSGDTVLNNLKGTANEIVDQNTNASDILAEPELDVLLTKSAKNLTIGPNALAEFNFTIDSSASNANLDDFVLTEAVPPELELVTIGSGTWPASPQVKATIEYQERLSKTWILLGVADATSDTIYQGGALGTDFPANVGKVRWVFNMPDPGIPSGFKTAAATPPRIWAKPLEPIPVGTTEVNNCMKGEYSDPTEGNQKREGICAEIDITNEPLAISDITKVSATSSNIGPEEDIEFRLELDLLEESSAPLVNPTVTDTLPAELTFVSWDNEATDFGGGIPENRLPAFTTDTLSTGETLLVWSWTGDNAWTIPNTPLDRVRKHYEIRYTAEPTKGTIPGTYTNIVTHDSESPNKTCGSNGDCSSSNDITVRGVGKLESNKWVSGDPSLNYVNRVTNPENLYILDSPFDPSCPDDGNGMTHYPCVARSYPGETMTYRLEVTNGGNVILEDYILYDVMSHVSDMGVSETLSQNPRDSKWSTLLTGPVTPTTLPPGITANDLRIEYSNLVDSCRREVSRNKNENGWQDGCVDDWTATPDNWEDVKSFRIAFADSNVQWPTLTSMIFSIVVRIPETGVPGGSAAWNSIAHRATNGRDNSRLLTADPIKAGVLIPYYDWGDLPDLDVAGTNPPAYNTDFTTVLGPGHMIIPQLYLGAGVDEEDDGQPGSTALGDDNTTGDYSVGVVDASGDDEDGVKFLTPIMPGQLMTIETKSFIDGVPGITATMGIWIDFNGDGTFDATEFFTHTVMNPAGGPAIMTGEIQITAPLTVAEEVYTRFRLAFDPDEVGQLENSVGTALSGEVEDYVLLSLGNRVWMDDGSGNGTPDNGILDGDEQGIPEVIVELYHPDDTPGEDPPLATTTTGSDGEYLFTGLEPGDYVVHLPDTNFAPDQPLEDMVSASDTPNSGDVDPDGDPDDETGPTGDENGINGPDPVTNGISSQPVTLETGNEPSDDGNGPNSNQTVDFAIVAPDLSMIKTRSPGQSYAPNFSTTPPTVSFDITLKNQGSATVYTTTVVDTIPAGMSFQSLITLTNTATVSDTGPAAGGHTFMVDRLGANESVTFQVILQIDDLSQGSYTNIAEVADIQDSSGNSIPDVDSTPDSDPSNDPVDTSEGIDPEGINDQNSHNDIDHDGPNDEDDHDQEVVLGGMALGNRVWEDRNNNGKIDDGEPGIDNVLVEVYAADENGNPVGAAVVTDNTDDNGYWLVDNLPPGDYIAVIPASNFAPSATLEYMISSSDIISTTGNPNTDKEGDDNGIGSPRGTTATGPISSGVITLAPTGEPLQGSGEGDLGPGHGNSGDIFDNLTVDFGFFHYDMTDGPDSYGTTLEDDGPRHILDGTTFLGGLVDSDPDGMPSLNADGDDASDTDDEDGVAFLTPIMAGKPFTITVQASTAGFLNSWIDFDGNGMFDPGEQLTTDQPLSAGTNMLVFTAPAVVNPDSLYSRFRFTANSGTATTPTGEATTGEVEDYIFMSLGNTVWADNGPDGASGNGIQDPSEPGIPGVIMELYPDGATPGVDEPLATTTTDENGDYLFTGLPPGDYVVFLPEENFAPDAPLEEHFSSGDPNDTPMDPDNNEPMDDNGVGDGTDDPTTEGIRTLPITLQPGTEPTGDGDGNQSNQTVSFGLVQYDKGDLPDSAAGVGPDNYETLTGNNGPMHGIVPNIYLGSSVDADLDGQPNIDATGDDGDSNGDDEDGVTFTSRILPGQMATMDVVANVAGYLNAWMDLNGDGDFDDPSEQLATDVNLITGTNSLSFPVPAMALTSDLYSRFRFTSDDPAGALSPNGTWNNGEVEDYGFHTQSLGNQVWHDLNNNGIQDAGEPGLDGVVVNLLDPTTDEVILTDTTTDGGHYLFNDLTPGDYRVEIAASNFLPDGPLAEMKSSETTESDPNSDVDGDDNGIDNGIDAPVGSPIKSGIVTLTDGGEPTDETAIGPDEHGNSPDEDSNLTVDFGFFEPVAVGDQVWLDEDRDGIQDPEEPGVPDVTVILYDPETNQPVTDDNGTPVTDVTDDDGNYLFDDLPPDDYIVVFDPDTLPEDHVPTTPNVANPEQPGISDETDSDVTINPVTQLPQTPPTGMINSGEEDLTQDFGIQEVNNIRVGDRVWFDDDKDGIQSPEDAGVPNINVVLYDAATGQPVTDEIGNPLIETTDGDGNYLFDELPAGNYYVIFDLGSLPQNYVVTQPSATNDDSRDSDADPTTGATDPTGSLGGGEEDLTLDMGIRRLDTVRVGDKVWYDTDRNGVQGSPEDEPGVPNVVVMLYDNVTDQAVIGDDGNALTDVTNSTGHYLFDNLPPGDYYTVFDLTTLPPNYVVTDQHMGGDDGVDSDANSTTGATNSTGMLNSNQQDLTLDMGIRRVDNVVVGDKVWLDSDKDGIQGDTEPGVPGVKVTLHSTASDAPVTDGSGDPLTDITDDNGEYTFTDLPPGDYYVVFDADTLPPNHVIAEPNQGEDDTVDSDADPDTGATSPTGVLNSNEQDLTLDLGIQQLDNIRIGDSVWFDNNKDGLQGPPEEEPGVPGMTVILYDAETGTPILDEDGNPLTDVTDENGNYLFENLQPGNYSVVFDLETLPQNYVVTEPSVGDDDTTDSDGDPTTGATQPTGMLDSGDEALNLDLGIILLETVRVGDRVWIDTDLDGIQGRNSDEPGVPDVTVTLYDNSTDAPVTDDDGNSLTDVTDDQGKYLFDDLSPGDYYVVFDLSTLPPNHIVTEQNLGDDDRRDSDSDPTSGATEPTGMLNSSQQDLTLDMGVVKVNDISVGDQVWFDHDGDGVQGPPEEEPGVPGMTIILYDANTEEPVTDEDGNPVTDVTDENGNYLFDELFPGNYYVVFDLSTLPQNYVPTKPSTSSDDTLDSDANPTTGATGPTGLLQTGDDDLSLDLGIVRLENIEVGDKVWYDTNKDGVQDAPEEEPGVPNVLVMLYHNETGEPVISEDGNPVTDATNVDGEYLFDDLPPGDYYVVFDLTTLPPNYIVTDQNMGGDDAFDSDVDPVTGATGPTGQLNSNQKDMSLDLGIQRVDNIVVGDHVWLDKDKDGIQGNTDEEPGVSDVVVTIQDTETGEPITDEDGTPLTDVTDEDGEYLFTDLPPGDYTVVFDLDTLPDNHVVTDPDATPQDPDALDPDQTPEDVDSDVDPSTGVSQSTGQLDSNESDLSLDLGVHELDNVRIGDRVWLDTNKDGLQGPPEDEPGVPDVTVTLYDTATGTPVTDENGDPLRDVTDENGNYLFDNLPSGDYYIRFDLGSLPDNHAATAIDPDDDPNLDSDGDPITGETEPTGQLNSGEEYLSLDLGVVQLPTVSVGNFVWLDENGNGIQNQDEEGIPGVTVYIYDEEGEKVTDNEGTPITQMTDENGQYLFTDLLPGKYYVEFDLSTVPDGFVVTPQNGSPSDALDSDANPETGITQFTALLLSGDRDESLDMGLYKPIKIGDQVWFDNGNGQQDDGEAGVPDIGVTLYRVNDDGTRESIGNTTTDDNGNYLFDDLPPGNYAVEFDLTTLPDGFIVTPPNIGKDRTDSDADPTTGQTAPTGFLSSGTDVLTFDMGITQPVEIGDTVWFDNDRDGLQDAGEPGVEGVTVTLHDVTGTPVGTTTTDSDGNYLFDGMIPGIYYVTFDLDTLPEGHVVAQPNAIDGAQPAISDELDSDANPETGRTPNTDYLLGGVVENTLDMGIHIPDKDLVRIGDLVWEDTNANGEFDPGEQGLPNITLELYSADDPTTPIDTTVTNEGGNYLFDGLLPGDYIVKVVPNTLPEDAYPPVYYGNDPPNNEASSSGPLGPGEEALNLDIAITRPGTLSGIAWVEDMPIDGIRTPTETVTSNITVLLLDTNGDLVAETVTGSDGTYLFEDLPPAEYQVQFTLPLTMTGLYTITHPQRGDDPTVDSDPELSTGTTGMIPVSSGEDVTDIDVGLVPPMVIILPPATIGSLVWNDMDKDGIQDEGEPGIAGAIVSLLDEDGKEVQQVITDDDGRFIFGVVTGTYQIFVSTVDLEEDVITLQNAGDDGRFDSDIDPDTGLTEMITVVSGDEKLDYAAGLFVRPSSVRLTSLMAEEVYIMSSVDGEKFGVSIKWSTSTELDVFGFEIYRGHDSNYRNASPIKESTTLSKGGDAEYEFIDTTPSIDRLYGYWLVEIQNDGTRVPHGPMRVEIVGVDQPVDILSPEPHKIYLPVVQQWFNNSS